MVKARVYKVAKLFDGEIKEDDLAIEEEELPPLEDGEYLAESLFLSVDPYMRAYSKTYSIGQVMIGVQVANITASKNPNFPVGETIVGDLGWRTHTIVKPSDSYFIYILPEMGNLSKSLSLGILGVTGVSAYFGFLNICEPVEGETVVVSAAGGAVGSVVGQIAKIKGCRVIGITGSEEKARWLESLGFDYVINYKTTKDLAEDLQIGAPNGIDCYFDNVGGDMSTIVMNFMNVGGRVSVCGSISAYNATTPAQALIVQPAILQKSLILKGFIVSTFKAQWMDAIKQLLIWVQEGKLKSRETITNGFEDATKALIGVLRGENIGKAVVRVRASHVENDAVDFKKALNMFRNAQ